MVTRVSEQCATIDAGAASFTGPAAKHAAPRAPRAKAHLCVYNPPRLSRGDRKLLSSVRWPLSMYSGREKPAAYKLLPVEKLLPTYCGPCTNVNCVYPLWSSPLFNVAAKVERSGPTLMYSARENASSAFFAGRHTQELHRRPRARGLYRARVRHRRTSVRGLAGT